MFDGDAQGHARVWIEVPDDTPVSAVEDAEYAPA